MTRRTISALAAVALLCAACTTGGRLSDPVEVSAVPVEDNSLALDECTPAQANAISPLASYKPLDALPAAGSTDDAFLKAIFARGKLVVGVSPDTLRFGARNLQYDPANPDGQLPYEGFDIDVLVQVAIAIFGGDGTTVGQHLEFLAMPYKDRIPKLLLGADKGGVDIVAHTMTINCKRWNVIDFSVEYFAAGQKVLVLKGSTLTGLDDMNAKHSTVCVPAGSTNLDKLNADYTGITQKVEADTSDCLVDLQQGTVEAITGDDTVLAGLAVQDPATVVVGDAVTSEPYGLGIADGHVYFVKFVNRVIANMIKDGSWAASYQKWLVPSLSADVPSPPRPDTSRPEPGS